ncbi:MAG: hypothetical protein DRN30_01510 [Thermoplasmata archaeon]|nr:MAG: hypothetical protein DRN30_01510 [Thermoplasmata archaeon]
MNPYAILISYLWTHPHYKGWVQVLKVSDEDGWHLEYSFSSKNELEVRAAFAPDEPVEKVWKGSLQGLKSLQNELQRPVDRAAILQWVRENFWEGYSEASEFGEPTVRDVVEQGISNFYRENKFREFREELEELAERIPELQPVIKEMFAEIKRETGKSIEEYERMIDEYNKEVREFMDSEEVQQLVDEFEREVRL